MKNTERFRKVLVRGGLFVLVLLAGGWWFENWRGAKAWEAARARAEEAGMSLERADYARPEIPDDENLRLHPLFEKELGRQDEGRLRIWNEEELAPSFPVTDLPDPQARVLACRLASEGRPQIWTRHQQEQDQKKLRWQFSAGK